MMATDVSSGTIFLTKKKRPESTLQTLIRSAGEGTGSRVREQESARSVPLQEQGKLRATRVLPSGLLTA